MISLKTPTVGVRPTILPKQRAPVRAGAPALTLRTRLEVRPAERLIELGARDARTLNDLGFPTGKQIAQPREWRGLVLGGDVDGFWLRLAEAPSGMEIEAWVEAVAFRDVAPSPFLRVLVRTWFEWEKEGGWVSKLVVVPNEGK